MRVTSPTSRPAPTESAERSESARARALSEALGPFVDELITPALIVDLDAVAANLRAALERFGGPGRWRPHLKTSKQAVIIEAMLDAGLRQFKVATCDELELLLRTAWAQLEAGAAAVDVLLAYPAQQATLRAALELARAHPEASVQLLADSPAHLEQLAAAWARLGRGEGAPAIPIMLDVDVGMHRTGSPPALWRELGDWPRGARLTGLHGYDGHQGWDRRGPAQAGHDALIELARELAARHELPLASLELVTSGTHSYAHALAHRGLDAGPFRHTVSPGTIVLSDRRSAPAAADIGLRQAAFVASRVISVGEGRVTLDAGSKGINPDVPAPGCAVLDHPELTPGQASEEHLPCRVDAELVGASVPGLGELLWLVPEHVCTTVNLHREAVWIREGRFAGVGPIGAAGHRPRFAIE